MIYRNVFIIGNGFDIDLGLKTKYSDFANSKYWPNQSGYSVPNLGNYLDDKKKKEHWFDIEDLLLQYARNDSKEKLSQDSNPETDITYFEKLRNSLCCYIKEQQQHDLKSSTVAEKILRAIIDNGFFDSIYSFNYTDLNVLARKLNIHTDIKYTHIHGKVEDSSIILGVDETILKKGYELMHKSVSEHYHSHNIFYDLTQADEVVFFGVSFGNIDFHYLMISLNLNQMDNL